jgi:protein-S-isoprenylcysteine O-methyltransferase Ste14
MSLAWELGLIYLVSEILLTLTRRSRSKTGTKQDRSTLGIIWLVIAVSITAGVFVAQNFGAAALPHGRMFASTGVVLFVAGLLLRWWAIITLGRFFTVDVTIEKDHEPVERGPFCIVRHPSYTGVLLAFVGLALSLRNWAALLVILVPIGAAFIHRMNVEEDALSRALGPRYGNLHKAHQTACALGLLRWPETLIGRDPRGISSCAAGYVFWQA